MKIVVVTGRPQVEHLLRHLGDRLTYPRGPGIPTVRQGCDPTKFDEETKMHLQKAEILFCEPGTLGLLFAANLISNLKWAQLTYAGVDALCRGLQGGPKPEFTITRMASTFANEMAEWVIGMIISWERGIWNMFGCQLEAKWNRDEFKHFRSLRDLSVCILGLGEIGKSVGRMCELFGMKVFGVVNRPRDDWKKEFSFLTEPPGDITQALNYDFCVNTLPSTKNTKGCLNPLLMESHPDCILINIGRGDVMSESVLIDALDAKRLRGAILDVFEEEPLPPDHRLWNHDKVIVSPHCCGESVPYDAVEVFLENLRHYTQHVFSGRKGPPPLEHIVDPEKGY